MTNARNSPDSPPAQARTASYKGAREGAREPMREGVALGDRWLLGILLLAALVRVAWLLVVDNRQFNDLICYDIAARGLATDYRLDFGLVSHHYRAWFLPGWPFFLAIFYKLFGLGTDVFKGVNLALSLLVVHLTVQIGARLFGRSAGLLAGLLMALLPGWMVYVSLAQYEVFLTALLTLVLFMAVRTDWSRATARHAAPHLLGVLMAWTVLTRPPLVLLPLVLAWFMGRAGAGRRAWALGAIVLAYVGAATLGWAVRNQAVLGEPVLFSTNAGYNIWHGNNPNASGGPISPPRTQDPRLNPAIIEGEVEMNHASSRFAMEYIRQDPARFVAMIPRRVFHLFYTDTTGIYLSLMDTPLNRPTILEPLRGRRSTLPEKVCYRSYLALMILALIGIALAPWRRAEVQFLGAVIAYWILPVAVTYGQDRYRKPLMPIFCLFAGLALQRALHLLKSQRA